MSANTLLTTDDNGDHRITIIKVLPNPSIITDLKKEQMTLKLQNDRFSYYDTKAEYPIEVSIIDKATPKDIAKYFPTAKFELVGETFQNYQMLTLPFALKNDKTWIYNILEGKAEQDRIILNDPDFVLLPNGNWSGRVEEVDQLHCLAIVKCREILSVRDLTADHTDLLKSILEKGCKAIETKYGVHRSQLRAYVHYHPTFWHLHVHFKLVQNISSYEFDRIHSIFSILQNIKIRSDYYQTVPLLISVPEDRVKLYTPSLSD